MEPVTIKIMQPQNQPGCVFPDQLLCVKAMALLQTTMEIMLAMSPRNGLALEFVSSVLRSQPVVMAAVAQKLQPHFISFARPFGYVFP